MMVIYLSAGGLEDPPLATRDDRRGSEVCHSLSSYRATAASFPNQAATSSAVSCAPSTHRPSATPTT